MSTEAVLDVGGVFPSGTKVSAYPRVGDGFTGAGSAHASATVTKDTEVHFKGLVENGPYWLVGEVDDETTAVAFTAHDEEVRGLAPDEAVSQAATRLGIEKASAGALAVRADDKALAPPPASSPQERHDGLHLPVPEYSPSDDPEVEQSEATQQSRPEKDRELTLPEDKSAKSGKSSGRTVKGARSSTNAKARRSTSRGAEGARARSKK